MNLRTAVSACVLATCMLSGFKTPALAQQRPFSTAPAIQLHGYDLSLGKDVQKVNVKLVALRLIDQLSTPDLQACLRAAGDSSITVKSYDSGSVRLRTAPGSCVEALTSRQPEDLGQL